jgi:hypothetical protein
MFYLKAGASLVLGGGGGHTIIYEDGTSITNGSGTFKCSSLVFDYTNAPPNKAFPMAVGDVAETSNVINIYPNPASDFINIEASRGLEQITLYDELGKNIVVARADPSTKFQMDISQVPIGVYYLRFLSAGKTTSKKIMITH